MLFSKKKPQRQAGDTWKKTSYSQCGEDIIVDFIFQILGIEKPSYIDIGAHHPYYLSNTALFYEKGCTGINIEPDPVLFKAFTEFRQKDINLNIGVGDETKEVEFFIMSSPTLNTFSKEEAQNFEKEGYEIKNITSARIDTLQNILRQYTDEKFNHFLTIDAEGVDNMIIRSIDFTKNYPLVICIETLSFSSSRQGIKNNKLIDFIHQQGYFTYADTNINTIFVKRDIW